MLEKPQWHCGRRIAPANRGYLFTHNKNARRQFEGSGRARRRPLFPKRNRPIGANSQWDDSPQAACGYMNFDNRSRLMQPSTRVGHRKATASRWVSSIPNALGQTERTEPGGVPEPVLRGVGEGKIGLATLSWTE